LRRSGTLPFRNLPLPSIGLRWSPLLSVQTSTVFVASTRHDQGASPRPPKTTNPAASAFQTGFRTVLECAGKAARPSRTDPRSVCRKPGRRVLYAPRRRRFPLAAMPWFGADTSPNPKRRRTSSPWRRLGYTDTADPCRCGSRGCHRTPKRPVVPSMSVSSPESIENQKEKLRITRIFAD